MKMKKTKEKIEMQGLCFIYPLEFSEIFMILYYLFSVKPLP